MSYRASDGTRQWDGSKQVPEERMAVKMQSFARTGITPDIAGADLSYALKLQYARWKAKGLESTIEIVPYGERKPQMPTRGFHWTDEKYSHERRVDVGKKTQKYFKDSVCIHTREKIVTIYAIVTNTTAENSVVENDYYCCPSCGASSKIKELMTGCPYCQTKFRMPDLFPKVTNFYFYEQDSSQPKFLPIAVTIGSVVALLYIVAFGILRHGSSGFLILLSAILLGAFAGFLGTNLFCLGYMIHKAAQGIGEIRGSKKAERKIEKRMKAIDRTFSYKLFEGQLISFLKMILFTDDVKNLVCFEGTGVPEKYRDLVDIGYQGAVTLKDIEMTEDVVKLNMSVLLCNTYFVNNKIKVKKEEIMLQVAQKASVPTDAGLSIKKVECKNCGGSFDGSHQRICPFCHTVYDMKEEGWVITKIGE
ncbi:MAG: hypothetical protein PUE81_09000 [Lachnospiraceae bacterium]|nr:hypothetical protein [Lachnospiraceae bacterium]